MDLTTLISYDGNKPYNWGKFKLVYQLDTIQKIINNISGPEALNQSDNMYETMGQNMMPIIFNFAMHLLILDNRRLESLKKAKNKVDKSISDQLGDNKIESATTEKESGKESGTNQNKLDKLKISDQEYNEVYKNHDVTIYGFFKNGCYTYVVDLGISTVSHRMNAFIEILNIYGPGGEATSLTRDGVKELMKIYFNDIDCIPLRFVGPKLNLALLKKF